MSMGKTEDIYINLKGMVENLIGLDISHGKKIKYEDLGGYINRVFMIVKANDTEELRKRLITDLEYEYNITHTAGAAIFDVYDKIGDWYNNAEITDTYFWSRYKHYLTNHSSLDLKSINLLDEKTLPEIMNCLGDPKLKPEGKKLRRGLIIGDVQSGKTATYIGLLCKAADAGYRVAILLAGTTESLREQTQARVDEGIVGLSTRKNGKTEETVKVGVGLDNQIPKATSYTSCANDFVKNSNNIAASLGSHNSLVLFVIKKNVSVLQKLKTWLEKNNLDAVHQWIDQPMLMIDDEADNASVNTRNDETDPTRTNKLIRQICNLFRNATYVGFTATPFANVFIDPDSVDSMKNADLFPQHFIYTLPTPSSYIGARRIFYDDGDHYGNLRFINDIEEPDYTSPEFQEAQKEDIDSLNKGTFYYRHKKEWHGIIPDSLKEAIYCFFLANAVRDMRGQQSKPRSMLVNMSRFVKIQRYLTEYVQQVYDDFVHTIRYDFKDSNEENISLPLYKNLKALWEKHFCHISDISFDRVIRKDTLISAVGNIEIMTVNGKSASSLNYKEKPSLRVIAVGGLALSRGLTLEGLTVSYFYRNTATFDVLMQMGRWFGYRPGYDDVCEIWISSVSASWYAEIAKASNELKDQIRTMFAQRLTPKDFGIMVRDDCDDLQITASNKMRKAFDLKMLFSFYGRMVDTPYVSRNIANNKTNLEVANKFAEKLIDSNYSLKFADVEIHKDDDVFDPSIGASRYFADVPKSLVLEFLHDIKVSLVNPNFNVKDLLEFIDDENTKGVDKWDIVFEGGDSDKHLQIDSLNFINCASRVICYHDRNVIQISSRRRILGTREGKFALDPSQIDEATEAQIKVWMDEDHQTREEAEKRDIPLNSFFKYLPKRKPVLIIMLIDPKPFKDKKDPTKQENETMKDFRKDLGTDQLVAFAIGFPGVKDAAKAKKFKVNKIYYELQMQDAEEVEEDDNEEK